MNCVRVAHYSCHCTLLNRPRIRTSPEALNAVPHAGSAQQQDRNVQKVLLRTRAALLVPVHVRSQLMRQALALSLQTLALQPSFYQAAILSPSSAKHTRMLITYP